MKTLLISLLAIIVLIQPASAQRPEDIQKAMKLTQEMLKDPKLRNEQIQKSPEGKAADQKVKEIAGSSENEQAIYELAASVFGSMAAETGGDPEKMQKLLDEGLKDPTSFANKWSPEQVKKLETISKEATPATTPPAPEKSRSRLIVHEPKPKK